MNRFHEEETMRSPARLALGVALAWIALPALAADPALSSTGPKGPMLTDPHGMTLYTFDRDAGGKSACNGPCATNWPPLTAPADAKPSGKFTVVAREDGTKQWAYDGKPLYHFKNDAKAGDVGGDGVNNVWHLATP
jgi:predicted lipoprotein with Yx(FWY)xxD motif